MNLCTLLRKFNWQEVDIQQEERVAVNPLQYYVEKRVQILGPSPATSHTLMYIPNHEIFTILAEVKFSLFLPKLQNIFIFCEKKNQLTKPCP